MKRFLTFLILLSFSSPCLADDMDFWDEPMKVDEAAKSQQRAVTDQEFEKVMSQLEAKKKKKADKNKPKGSAINNTLKPEDVPSSGEMGIIKNMYESYPTVMLPVALETQYGGEIPPGYYRILSVKKDYGFFLNFYQGNSLIARVQAIDSGNDHNQKSLNYAKVIPNGNSHMYVIYGDIDCNLEATLKIKN